MAIRATVSRRAITDYQAFQDAHPDFLQNIERLRKYQRREFTKLAALSGRNRHSRVRKLLGDRALHLLYAYEGLRKAKALRGASPASIEGLATRCNPYAPCDEREIALTITSGGRSRLVAAYGPAKRMRQLLIADLLRVLHPPLEQQFLLRGGMPAAFRAVETAYAEGFTVGVEIDIIDFYGSVRLEGLAELLRPLPPRVVESVVWDRAVGVVDDVATCSSYTSSWRGSPSLNGQTGIAKGSASSPVVSERIIASLIAPFNDIRIVTYADNVVVLGRTAGVVEEYVQTMHQQAAGFAGWPLRLRSGGVTSLAGPHFAFLHHNLAVTDSGFVWMPDERKRDEYLLAESSDDLSEAQIDEAERKVSSWRRAYPGWPEGDLWEVRQLAGLAARRFYLSATPLNRTRAVQSLIASFFANGRWQSISELAPSGGSPKDDRRREELINVSDATLVTMATYAQMDAASVRYRGHDGGQ